MSNPWLASEWGWGRWLAEHTSIFRILEEVYSGYTVQRKYDENKLKIPVNSRGLDDSASSLKCVSFGWFGWCNEIFEILDRMGDCFQMRRWLAFRCSKIRVIPSKKRGWTIRERIRNPIETRWLTVCWLWLGDFVGCEAWNFDCCWMCHHKFCRGWAVGWCTSHITPISPTRGTSSLRRINR